MNSFLLNRQLGSISPQALAKAQNARLLSSLQASSILRLGISPPARADRDGVAWTECLAHPAGYTKSTLADVSPSLISAGADSSLAVWDLEATLDNAAVEEGHAVPLVAAASGYDHTLKLFSSETLTASASFDIGSIVYSHATSAVASHLLVACASQHPAVRLVDLRSGANTHSLAGHSGSALTVAWHPKNENILASGASDGVVRVWDIRRSASSLGVLDAEDSVGIVGYDGTGTGARGRERGRSHKGAVNGVVWTEDGQYIVSAGHDERMRVWDMITGANTLANFGPGLKNSNTTVLLPLVIPSYLTGQATQTVFYPNPREVLSFDLHSGSPQSRLRVMALPGTTQAADTGSRNVKNRTTSLAWRAHHIEMFSAHGDGSIRRWRPKTWEDALADKEDDGVSEDAETVAAARKRKREDFDQIIKDLTNKKITFT